MATNNIINNSVNISGNYIPIISGNWYKCGGPLYYNALYTTGSFVTGTIYYKPFFVPVTTTFTQIATYVTTGIAGNVNMAIFNSNAAGTMPTGTAITNSTSGSQSTAGTGAVAFTFGAAITLTPGTYWLAMMVSATVSFAISRAPTASVDNVAGFGWPAIAVNDNSAIIGYTQTAVYATSFPTVSGLTAAGASTANSGIVIWLKAQ